MNSPEFEYVVRLLRERAGIVIGPDKEYLLDLRLGPVVKSNGLHTLTELVDRLKAGAEALVSQVVDSMTTNETSFFRDGGPFDLLRTAVLPELTAQRSRDRPIRIWCAAASTGQEPYSLAMLLRENRSQFGGHTFEIVATDIATHVLARAEAGIYSRFEVQRGMPPALLAKYFDRDADDWQIKSEIRKSVTFRRHNLMSDPRALGLFDLVLCRNVLIYFDQPTKARVLERIAGQLRPGGKLLLGGAETVFGISSLFQPVTGMRGAFERVASPAVAAARMAAVA